MASNRMSYFCAFREFIVTCDDDLRIPLSAKIAARIDTLADIKAQNLLIAQANMAPDLLRALTKIAGANEVTKECYDIARAAIAKATGE